MLSVRGQLVETPCNHGSDMCSGFGIQTINAPSELVNSNSIIAGVLQVLVLDCCQDFASDFYPDLASRSLDVTHRFAEVAVFSFVWSMVFVNRTISAVSPLVQYQPAESWTFGNSA